MDNKLDEYLTKAANAEAIAEQMDGQYLKQSWLDIAEGYRELARIHRELAVPAQGTLSVK